MRWKNRRLQHDSRPVCTPGRVIYDDRMVDGSPSAPDRFLGAGFDTWAGSPFVQARLGLLGKTKRARLE